MVKQAIANKYTDIVVINEDNRVPNGLLVTHLPEGPTALFKLSNVKITKDIKVKALAFAALCSGHVNNIMYIFLGLSERLARNYRPSSRSDLEQLYDQAWTLHSQNAGCAVPL